MSAGQAIAQGCRTFPGSVSERGSAGRTLAGWPRAAGPRQPASNAARESLCCDLLGNKTHHGVITGEGR